VADSYSTAERPSEAAEGPPRGRLWWRLAMVGVAAVALYLFAPVFTELLSAWPDLAEIAPGSFALMFLAELTSFGCVWLLQRLAFVGAPWFALISSQLASNAFSRVVPGGAAAGGALQYRMLTDAGVDTARSAAGLTAISLITTASVFMLPLLSVPAIATGVQVPSGLLTTAWVGGIAFALMFLAGLWLVVSDQPLMLTGRFVIGLQRRLGREVDPNLSNRLLSERAQVVRSLGARWPWAVATSVGKWLFDYLALLAALAAVGDETRPSLVLLAYVAGAVLAMIPITPGGLGFVEAGLLGGLTAAGVTPGRAAIAVLAYRLVSYWLPLMAGLGAWVSFRARARLGGVSKVAN
jgi:uncharacterized protein (TIRG00374 family)